jgi:hypothetical protein
MLKLNLCLKTLVFLSICFYQANASTITSKAVTGSWTTGTNWVGDIAPSDEDDVIIVSGSNITISSGIICASLTINNGGIFSVESGTITVNGNITGSGDITVTSGVINISGNWTNNGTFTAGSGTVNYITVNGGQSIGSNIYNNLSLQNTSSTNIISGNITVGGSLTLAASGSGKTILGSQTLTLQGDLINASTARSFIANGTSSITINGSGALSSNIYLDQSVIGTTNRLQNLIFNRSGETITLGDTIEIIGTIIPTAGTLATSDKLKLISNATGTARVAAGSSNNYITGKVIGERHIPALDRRWRFFSPPISGATLQDLKNEIYITGAGGSLNGFDQTTSNQASVYTYNESVTTGNLNNGWTAATNINNTLAVGRGVRIFIRGDRSDIGRLDGTVAGQNAVVVNLTGPLNMGDITIPVTYTSSGNDANDGWNFVGNPYASPYDWDAFFDAQSGTPNCFNIEPTIYIYNPTGDGYVSFNALGAEPGTGDLTDGIVPTIAGFWVKANGSNPTLVLSEQYKIATPPAQVFKTYQNEGFKIRLEKDSISFDDVIVKYMNGSTNNYDDYDILKLSSVWTNISAYGTDNVQLTASVRPLTILNDTIKLNINANATGNYKMKFYNSTNLPIGENVYLIDNYLNTVTDIKTTLVYPITIDYTASGNGTYGQNRFYIVAGTTQPVPVKWLLFAANQKGSNQVVLNWSTAQEINNAGYEIEQSEDGKNFTKIGNIEGNRTSEKVNNYSFIDNHPNRINYYRIKQIDFDGKVSYTEVRRVLMDSRSLMSLQIYPVPAKDLLTINHTQPVKEIKIYNSNGNLELTQTAMSNEMSVDIADFSQGVYLLEVYCENGEVIQNKFVKE